MLKKQWAEGKPREETQEDDKDPRNRIIKRFSASMANNACDKHSVRKELKKCPFHLTMSIPFINAQIMSDSF